MNVSDKLWLQSMKLVLGIERAPVGRGMLSMYGSRTRALVSAGICWLLLGLSPGGSLAAPSPEGGTYQAAPPEAPPAPAPPAVEGNGCCSKSDLHF